MRLPHASGKVVGTVLIIVIGVTVGIIAATSAVSGRFVLAQPLASLLGVVAPDTTRESVIESAEVRFVVDGDSFELDTDERVRLIGVDAPENGELYYTDAREALKKLIEGRTVRLERDVSHRDPYGRLLRYAYIDDIFINERLAREGYVRVRTYPPDTLHQDILNSGETEARANKRGIWSAGEQGPILLSEVRPGEDGFIVLKNATRDTITMTGWTLGDDDGNTYVFPPFSLPPDESVTIQSRVGVDTPHELYWGRTGGVVWDETEDRITLKNTNNQTVFEQQY